MSTLPRTHRFNFAFIAIPTAVMLVFAVVISLVAFVPRQPVAVAVPERLLLHSTRTGLGEPPTPDTARGRIQHRAGGDAPVPAI